MPRKRFKVDVNQRTISSYFNYQKMSSQNFVSFNPAKKFKAEDNTDTSDVDCVIISSHTAIPQASKNKKPTPKKSLQPQQDASTEKTSVNVDDENKNVNGSISQSPSSIIPTISDLSSTLGKRLEFMSSSKMSPQNSNANPNTSITFQSPQKSKSNLTTPTKSTFTPRKKSEHNLKWSPKGSKYFFVDKEKLYHAIKNMNYVKERSGDPHIFDLEKIYLSQSFEYKYDKLDMAQTTKYDFEDVSFPRETYSDHIFMIISEVFFNKINCEYFTKEEMDKIFQYLTMEAGAQILFAKMIRRKRGLHRVKTMVKMDEEIKKFFPHLLDNNFLTSDISTYDLETLLNLLQADEIKQLSLKFKVDASSKEKSIKQLLKYKLSNKSYFGNITPVMWLRTKVEEMLGLCVSIPDNILSIFDRIFILFSPTEYPMNPIADIFKMMLDLEQEKIIFYNVPNERYPIFRNRDHLLNYTEGQLTYFNAVQASENKNWDAVVEFGKIAFNHLKLILEGTLFESQQEQLPAHVQRFFPGHIWAKIVWHSITALKKSKHLLETAELYLNTLLNQNIYVQKYRGQWYDELALIKSHHQKDHEKAASLLMEGLVCNGLTQIDINNLVEKLKKHAKRKTGISESIKCRIENLLQQVKDAIPEESFATITINGNKIKRYESNKGKSMWTVPDNDNNMRLTNVEQVAVDYYRDCGFMDSWHCEGSLPVLLFVLVFWDEMYKLSVPGAFVSAYQDAPLDLYTQQFYKHRKKEINAKLEKLKIMDHSTFVEYLTEMYETYKQYQTILPKAFEEDEHFHNMIECLGINPILSICQKVLQNFRLWRSGFPDLIVWNVNNKSYKIIEVKGPNDTLSTKQRLWMQHLQQCGICTELCHVKAN